MQNLESKLNINKISKDIRNQAITTREVNNHVHSTYSFSPYSPTEIIIEAIKAGLQTIGLMDHDTVAGAEEFLIAGKKLGIATTVGCEIRVRLDIEKYKNKHINNPDEPNIIYIALHGIPRRSFREAQSFLEPIRLARKERMHQETKKLNALLSERGVDLTINFKEDIVNASKYTIGGTITERHILFSLANTLIKKSKNRLDLVNRVEGILNNKINNEMRIQLLDKVSSVCAYDLLGLFKSSLVSEFFIPSSNDECPTAKEAISFSNSIGSIASYAYLGDVGSSPTGDKKPQIFEDSFLEYLIADLKEIGFQAVTYMPPRNTYEQLDRLQKLCKKYQLMEISGVDINSPGQSFNCPILLESKFIHLVDAAWALIAHEKLTEKDPSKGLFYNKNLNDNESIENLIKEYANIGKRLDPS